MSGAPDDHEPQAADAAPFDAGDDLADRVRHARQRHGLAGGILASAMLGIDQAVNGRKPREEAPIVVDANSDPTDIDTDGISVELDDHEHVAFVAPALPRRTPITTRRGRRRPSR